ncbi:Butirosin biosynthesis, BtrG-like protein [Mycena galopus ATCC 62051]|nr:Butirosin biosynthesis, BtrG-like protein [Mycena galopus ATCC 62051]
MASPKTLYFGYGSNLWRHQMDMRCPDNKFLGTARLPDWRWIINEAGYATVLPSNGDEVWALLYELSPADEEKLDGYEAVPRNYVKQIIPVEYFAGKNGRDYGEMRQGKPPKREYIFRMNSAMADALADGVPKAYIEKYLRRFIPTNDNITRTKESETL